MIVDAKRTINKTYLKKRQKPPNQVKRNRKFRTLYIETKITAISVIKIAQAWYR